ncbi:MAG: helix-turn-helix transcriptional regulator [Anaeromyxobacteraceae bacterium]
MDDLHKMMVSRVRAAARKKRWSANQLADFAGVSRGYLSDVLTGKKSPTLRTMGKIAGALEVPVRDLLPEK